MTTVALVAGGCGPSDGEQCRLYSYSPGISRPTQRLNHAIATAGAASVHAIQQAQQAAQQAELAAGDSLQAATWQATNLAEHACAMARQAAASAAAQLAGAADQIKSMSIDDWVTRLGAAGLPLEIMGLTGIGMAGDKLSRRSPRACISTSTGPRWSTPPKP